MASSYTNHGLTRPPMADATLPFGALRLQVGGSCSYRPTSTTTFRPRHFQDPSAAPSNPRLKLTAHIVGDELFTSAPQLRRAPLGSPAGSTWLHSQSPPASSSLRA